MVGDATLSAALRAYDPKADVSLGYGRDTAPGTFLMLIEQAAEAPATGPRRWGCKPVLNAISSGFSPIGSTPTRASPTSASKASFPLKNLQDHGSSPSISTTRATPQPKFPLPCAASLHFRHAARPHSWSRQSHPRTHPPPGETNPRSSSTTAPSLKPSQPSTSRIWTVRQGTQPPARRARKRLHEVAR